MGNLFQFEDLYVMFLPDVSNAFKQVIVDLVELGSKDPRGDQGTKKNDPEDDENDWEVSDNAQKNNGYTHNAQDCGEDLPVENLYFFLVKNDHGRKIIFVQYSLQ